LMSLLTERLVAWEKVLEEKQRQELLNRYMHAYTHTLTHAFSLILLFCSAVDVDVKFDLDDGLDMGNIFQNLDFSKPTAATPADKENKEPPLDDDVEKPVEELIKNTPTSPAKKAKTKTTD